MKSTQFVYTTYMKTTPEKVWQAITNPEFARQYWGHGNVSDWKKGSPWYHVEKGKSNNEARVCGEVIEVNPPKRLVITWVEPSNKSDQSRVTFEIDSLEDMVRLVVTHDKLVEGSDMASKISVGWPLVLSNMKTYLETNKTFNLWAWKAPCDQAKA